MMNEGLTERAEAYAMLRGLELSGTLGAGLNGAVLKVRGKRESEWPDVRRALAELESLGIYYFDVHRDSISP